MLAIAEAKMNPGIRDLLLRGCYDCTDTGVSWLAERCPTIVCLNVLVRRSGDCRCERTVHSWWWLVSPPLVSQLPFILVSVCAVLSPPR